MTGTLTGVVMDNEANEPMPFATVVIKGTTKGATTDIDGKFTIQGIEPGIYTLVASFVGYEVTEIGGLVVEEGKSTEVALNLGTSELELEEVVVTAKAQTESEMTLIQVQRKSVEIKQSIGAQELSRKGVSDAETAVTKVTGVSKQEGSKNVFVRGLGDRYNSTSLNGLPLPSEDPEYKNINLGFFNTNIINSIDVNKTFGTSLYGDVGGANINIVSKELFDDQELQIGASVGANSQVMGSSFTRIDGTGYFGADKVSPTTNLSQYAFANSFDAYQQESPINSSFSIRGGKRFYVNDKALNTLIIASNGSNYGYAEGNANANFTSSGNIGKRLFAEKYTFNTNQSVIANANYELNRTDIISFNSLYVHSNNQEFAEYEGFYQNITETDGTTALLRRQQVNDNTLLVNQLHADLRLTDKINLETAVGLNLVNGNEPDRRTNTFIQDDATGAYVVAAGSAGLNHRFYSELQERDVVGSMVATYKLGTNEALNSTIKVGYNFRNTDRDFAYRQFSFNIFGARPAVDINNVDAIFNQAAIDNGSIEIWTNRGRLGNPDALDADTYNGNRQIHAGYVNATYELSEALTVDGGVRVEYVNQDVTWDFNQDRRRFDGDNLTNINKVFILPSLNIKYLLNDDNIVRFAATKTYIMPQFKEVAPFLYESVQFGSYGNPYLVPSNVYNLDIKIDHYFSRGELISIGGFYKSIENPINRINVISAASELSYVNFMEKPASVAGFEVELRKTLVSFNSETYIDAGFNVSYLHSYQRLSNTPDDGVELIIEDSYREQALQGASPWLYNADLTFYKQGNGINMTSALVFQSFNNRLFSLTNNNIGGFTDQGVDNLNWITSVELSQKTTVSASVMNILNQSYRQTTEAYTTGEIIPVSNYRNGVQFSLGLSYKLF
jgi:outer membrane receptor protein involved in Fe transport